MEQNVDKRNLLALQRRTAELLEQQAQADALFASIGDGAIATDARSIINRVNQPALDMLGFRREELIGKRFQKALVAVDKFGKPLKPMQRPITRSFLDGKAISENTFYTCKDGSVIPVAITVSPITLGGRPIGAVEVFRDISREQAVDRMKTEFIYLASHQLRTPLSAVKTYAHMLGEGYRGKLTPEQAEFMNVMIHSLDRMNDIINTLLNISRMESGMMAVTPVPLRLRDIVSEAISELHPAITQKQLLITTTFKESCAVLTDQLLVKELCLNLLSNAVKYTPASGTITATITEKDDKQIVAIKDTGYGIPEDAQKHIFGKFYRAPNVLERENDGTGLGLYLVKGIANVLGGDVWFDSVENKGSTFYFSLPCHQAPVATDTQYSGRASGGAATQARQPNAKARQL